MATRKKKKGEEPEADVVVLAPPRMDVSDHGDADQARRVDGVLIKPTEKWPFAICMVSLGSRRMKHFVEKARNSAISIANAEKGQRASSFGRFERIPLEFQNIARVKCILECLRGGGTGVYAWRGSDPGELDLRGSTTEQVRAAFERSFKALDFDVSTDLLDELESAAKGIDLFEDPVVLEAKKNGTVCGVPPRPARAESGILGTLLGGGEDLDPMALLAMLAKSKATMEAATLKVPESPTP